MKKALSTLLVIAAALMFWVPTGNAQVTTSTAGSSPAFSLTNSVYPNLVFPITTVTGTGTAKFNIGGMSGASVRITGTYSAITAQIQVSNDNTNFTPVMLVPVSAANVGGQTLTGASTAVNGLYYINLAGMTQIQISDTAFTGTSATIRIVGSAVDYPKQSLPVDPCQDPNIQKQSASVAISTATTTQLVAAVTGKNVYVCDFLATVGATTTIVFKAGTQTTNPCDTGAVTLSGVFTPATGSELFLGYGGTVFGPPQIPVSNQVCGTSTGTGGINGTIVFVQV